MRQHVARQRVAEVWFVFLQDSEGKIASLTCSDSQCRFLGNPELFYDLFSAGSHCISSKMKCFYMAIKEEDFTLVYVTPMQWSVGKRNKLFCVS